MNANHCSSCGYFITQRKTVYVDGSEIITYQAPEGRGFCDKFNREEPADFGCVHHAYDGGHVAVTRKDGTPADFWQPYACPDCEGRGSTNSRACRRCSGTGQVRRYDDGYIADATWDHPREKERKRTAKEAAKLEDPNTTLRPLPSAQGAAMGNEGGG